MSSPEVRDWERGEGLIWQYACARCGNKRDGLLDRKHGIGGYSWACPECGSHEITSWADWENATWVPKW